MCFIDNVVSRLKKVEPPPAANHPKVSRLKKYLPVVIIYIFALWRLSGAFRGRLPIQSKNNYFLIGLPLGMTLIGFGDVITAGCLPRQKSQRIDKDFDQNRNAKMLANMLANFVQVPDFLTYASEIYDIGTEILLLQ